MVKVFIPDTLSAKYSFYFGYEVWMSLNPFADFFQTYTKPMYRIAVWRGWSAKAILLMNRELLRKWA